MKPSFNDVLRISALATLGLIAATAIGQCARRPGTSSAPATVESGIQSPDATIIRHKDGRAFLFARMNCKTANLPAMIGRTFIDYLPRETIEKWDSTFDAATRFAAGELKKMEKTGADMTLAVPTGEFYASVERPGGGAVKVHGLILACE